MLNGSSSISSIASTLSSESSLQYPEVRRESLLFNAAVLVEDGLEYGKDRLLDLLELLLLLLDEVELLVLLEELLEELLEVLRDEQDDEDELRSRILACNASNSSLERFLKLYNA